MYVALTSQSIINRGYAKRKIDEQCTNRTGVYGFSVSAFSVPWTNIHKNKHVLKIYMYITNGNFY